MSEPRTSQTGTTQTGSTKSSEQPTMTPSRTRPADLPQSGQRRTVSAILATRPLMLWRGIDLITAAMLAVAFGVMFWGFDTFIYPVLSLATTGFPPAGELMLGVWLLPAVVGALVIRRPGAALLTELVAANIELVLGNKWGAAVLVSAVLQGLGVELALALFRHRRFGVVVAALGGTSAATLEIVLYEWRSYVPAYSAAWKAIYLGAGMVSGGVIAGIGGWFLVRALAKSGALNAFPPGQEVRESQPV
jgi:energy-coupling factor transport system substrate-specific component